MLIAALAISSAEGAASLIAVVAITALATMLITRRATEKRLRRASPAAVRQDGLELASAQLDSPDIGLRLPALAALEEHANAVTGDQQVVVELLCAYLRRPPDRSDEAVRGTAQRILQAHLIPGHGFWGVVDLDLDRAMLNQLDLSGAVIGNLRCRRAQLGGDTTLTGARICGTGAFSGTLITGPAHLTGAWFEGPTAFDRCTFGAATSFAGTTFHGVCDLTSAVFCDEAVFSDRRHGPAVFEGPADMRRARFTRAAQFNEVMFLDWLSLDGTEFCELPAIRPDSVVAAALAQAELPG